MKRLLKSGAVTLSLLLAAVAGTYAQTTNTANGSRPSGVLLSVGPEAGLPVGKLKNAYDWSLGGSVQAEMPVVNKSLYLLLNAGYNNFFAKDDVPGLNNMKLIPVKAGLKFYPYKNLYVQGAAGVSFLSNKDEVAANKSAVFVYSPQVGYLIPIGKNNYLDAGVKFESMSKLSSVGSSNNFFGVRVAYGLGI
ncbi:hypothetical protein HNQ91_005268 [Filimonas zeae]|uniref:Outer membrane protein beta-barrel domain-containing protein n=1 Tax=Filimonas zeae TaxID=1737353 RepID=A0A917J3W9_9BACT|nr:hypothetical protein [Filimonas zeae]MDR6342191.1 hypothetical protein [Filimonas zeae]GGH78752.1 hypothetical protein GCM10011379_47080 [Filimonas zeae]